MVFIESNIRLAGYWPILTILSRAAGFFDFALKYLGAPVLGVWAVQLRTCPDPAITGHLHLLLVESCGPLVSVAVSYCRHWPILIMDCPRQFVLTGIHMAHVRL